MAGSGAIECQVVRILDTHGTLLTAATAGSFDDEGRITLDEVDDHGVLLNHYFGRGERLVIVERDGRTVEAVLDTRWVSAVRIWWIGVSSARAVQALARIAGWEQEPDRSASLPAEDVRADERVPAPLVR